MGERSRGTNGMPVDIHVHVHDMYMLMRDEEERKKEASKVKQTTKQSNTANPRQSLFQRKMSCLGWDGISHTLLSFFLNKILH